MPLRHPIPRLSCRTVQQPATADKLLSLFLVSSLVGVQGPEVRKSCHDMEGVLRGAPMAKRGMYSGHTGQAAPRGPRLHPVLNSAIFPTFQVS